MSLSQIASEGIVLVAKAMALFGLALVLSTLEASAVSVPNSSFEESGSHGPVGWTFTGHNEAFAAAWTSEEPFAGKRALRIDAKHGSQQWESDAIPVRTAQKYLLRWQARFQGEKVWRFSADFCGVEIVFKDKQGLALGSDRQHTSCWKTRGWQPGWFLFTVPAGSEMVNLRFAIHTTKPLPGGFDVDAVELDEWPPVVSAGSSNLGLLALKIEDELGKPVGARIRIANSRVEAVRPPGAIAYEQANGDFHPIEEGVCHALVPRGTYSITVTRGFEYEPWEQKIELTQGPQETTIRLHRLWNWRQRGWFSGDHHTHLFRHGGSLYPSLRWPDVMRVARAEGLDFLPFMGADRYPADTQQTDFRGQATNFVYELTEEITEDFWGHVCPIGATPQSRRDRRYDEGPMNFDRYAAIAGSGGILSYGHPYGPLTNADNLEALSKPGHDLVAREFPIDLALGIPCAMDLLAMEGPHNQLARKLHDLYRLWNLGFRPVVAASTDFHVDQGRQPIGSVRTYVRAGALDMPSIAQAYRAGHTFATSGPLLDLRVGGAGPGDELRLPASGERVQVDVEAVSIGQLDRVEILVNGKVFRTFSPVQEQRITGACQVTAERSLWIAARAYGPEDRHLASQLEGRALGAAQFAHTTPVYVLVEGRPIFAAETADADYFVRWCDAVLAGCARPEPVVKARLARARRVFADLAGHPH
jgi:hypothetical protein